MVFARYASESLEGAVRKTVWWLPLIGFLALLPAKPAWSAERYPGPYPAEVIRVADGAHFIARLRVFWGVLVETEISIIGIAAPAIHGACEAESTRAQLALETTKALLMIEPVTVYDVSPGPQGNRFKARVMNGAGVDVGAMLARGGYAQPDDDALDAANPWCP